ncbi:MAG: glycosyltransferase family 4 protein [Proteobacteria bacterium]|nr:glycosyltransferase family 4 protein [Pseudomonadota bacterium]MBI3497658.1 glycosyltransferase family 4 protein [Pseudomonadota bacterium]
MTRLDSSTPSLSDGRPAVILQVLPSLTTGGVERGTVDVAHALMRAGCQAIVASSGGTMVRELERAGATHMTLPVDSKNPWRMRANIEALSELILRHEVDLVHARSRAPAWSAYFAAKRTQRPFITTFHGTYGAGNPLKRLYNSVMTRGDRVIAISRFIARHLTETYGTDPKRIRVIPRGVDFLSFAPEQVKPERISTLSRTWRLPDGVPLVLLPGRLTRWKGQTVLIEALAELQRSDLVCVIAGSEQGRAAYRRELEALIQARGLASQVRLVGECRDMPAAYMLADVVVSASTEPEAFGRVVAEAQAMGRPVVATDHGGSLETLLPGETGWLVKPRDASGLAHALATALGLGVDARRSLSERAIANARQNFSKEVMCRDTLKVYAEVLQSAEAEAA